MMQIGKATRRHMAFVIHIAVRIKGSLRRVIPEQIGILFKGAT
jgi:hypothetical protein